MSLEIFTPGIGSTVTLHCEWFIKMGRQFPEHIKNLLTYSIEPRVS